MFLGREGHGMSRHRAHRLWRLEGLQLPRRRPRRRVALGPSCSRNRRWSSRLIIALVQKIGQDTETAMICRPS